MSSTHDGSTPPVKIVALPSPHPSPRIDAPSSSTTKYVPSTKPTRRKPTPFYVVDFFSTADGREAGLRALQYSLRFTLYLRRHKLSTPLLSRLLALVSTLSALRRLVALIDLSTFIYHSWDPFYYLRAQRKGKAKATPGMTDSFSDSSSNRIVPELSTLLHLSRQSLDLISTLSDNVYLFSKLRLIPLSERRTRSADRLADFSTLLAALFGLVQVAHSRHEIWEEGRAVRKEAVRLEDRLDQLEMSVESQIDGRVVSAEEKMKEERLLRDRVRSQRQRLKSLRDELTDLWWERLRLGSESLFAVWDVLDLDIKSEMIKSCAGLTSASIMISQAWRDFVPVRK